MITEFDLPCDGCGHDLERTIVDRPNGAGVTVADCPNCGSRFYPRSALDRF